MCEPCLHLAVVVLLLDERSEVLLYKYELENSNEKLQENESKFVGG